MKEKILVGVILVTLVLTAGAVMAAKGGKNVGCATIKDGTIEYGRVGNPSTEILSIGYDQWGYNYQAHMFNGMYCDSYRDAAWCQEWKDVKLMMKWSDEWLSNKDCNGDGKLDRGYSCAPVDAKSSACEGAWLTNHQSGSYLGNWQLVGDWVIAFDFGSLYVHDMSITEMTGNSFSGTGGYPSGGLYSHPWTATGTVDGNNVELEIVYGEGAPNPGYTVSMTGSISQDGSMSGDCTTSASQTCTWESTSGEATGETCKWNYFVKIVAAPADAYTEGDYWYTADDVEIGPVIWGAFAVTQQVENDACAGIHGLQYNSPSPTGFGYYK